jgi:hypothetical protein
MRKRKQKTVTIPRPPAQRFWGASLRRMGALVLLLVIAALSAGFSEASASDLLSQEKTPEKPYAVISGTVWGPDDQPVYRVKVKIRLENEKKARWEVYSDHHGEFAQRVPAGKADYVAWADLKGYKSINGNRLQPGESVTIHVEYDERVDTGLHLK